MVFAVDQGAVQLVAGADAELGEDLVQVVFDGTQAHERLSGDVRVGQALAGQPGDLGFPGGEPIGWISLALAHLLAGGTQLTRGPFGKPVGLHGGEHLVSGTQRLAGIHAAVLAAQPFSVNEMSPG